MFGNSNGVYAGPPRCEAPLNSADSNSSEESEVLLRLSDEESKIDDTGLRQQFLKNLSRAYRDRGLVEAAQRTEDRELALASSPKGAEESAKEAERQSRADAQLTRTLASTLSYAQQLTTLCKFDDARRYLEIAQKKANSNPEDLLRLEATTAFLAARMGDEKAARQAVARVTHALATYKATTPPDPNQPYTNALLMAQRYIAMSLAELGDFSAALKAIPANDPLEPLEYMIAQVAAAKGATQTAAQIVRAPLPKFSEAPKDDATARRFFFTRIEGIFRAREELVVQLIRHGLGNEARQLVSIWNEPDYESQRYYVVERVAAFLAQKDILAGLNYLHGQYPDAIPASLAIAAARAGNPAEALKFLSSDNALGQFEAVKAAGKRGETPRRDYEMLQAFIVAGYAFHDANQQDEAMAALDSAKGFSTKHAAFAIVGMVNVEAVARAYANIGRPDIAIQLTNAKDDSEHARLIESAAFSQANRGKLSLALSYSTIRPEQRPRLLVAISCGVAVREKLFATQMRSISRCER